MQHLLLILAQTSPLNLSLNLFEVVQAYLHHVSVLLGAQEQGVVCVFLGEGELHEVDRLH